jgi:hypothetical protein
MERVHGNAVRASATEQKSWHEREFPVSKGEIVARNAKTSHRFTHHHCQPPPATSTCAATTRPKTNRRSRDRPASIR